MTKKTETKAKAKTPLSRAKDELSDLQAKIEAAGKAKLKPAAQHLLNAQISHMKKYAAVLAVRIANW